MLINFWIGHPEISRDHELLIHIWKMRMATRKNLGAIMGKTLGSIDQQLHALRKKGDYIRSFRPKGKFDESVYFLGVEGAKLVGEVLNKKISFYDYKGKQARHFTGINDIMTRLINRIGLESFKEETEWQFTGEARDTIQREWAELLLERNVTADQIRGTISQLPEPDARVTIGSQSFWLEFDNATEAPSIIKEKLDDYIWSMVPIQNRDPIIWVVTKRFPNRAERFRQLWQEVQHHPKQQERFNQYVDRFFFPQMFFLIEGSETEILARQIPSLSAR
jgi:hypothetical protein